MTFDILAQGYLPLEAKQSLSKDMCTWASTVLLGLPPRVPIHIRHSREHSTGASAYVVGLSLLQRLANACNDLQVVRQCICRLCAHKVIALLQQAPAF